LVLLELRFGMAQQRAGIEALAGFDERLEFRHFAGGAARVLAVAPVVPEAAGPAGHADAAWRAVAANGLGGWALVLGLRPGSGRTRKRGQEQQGGSRGKARHASSFNHRFGAGAAVSCAELSASRATRLAVTGHMAIYAVSPPS
jgi:hypothetical protein